MNNEISNHSVRQLIRSCTKGYLSTQLDKENPKKIIIKSSALPIPYATFVSIAFDYDASPTLILSDLSEHTKNLKKITCFSLIYEEQKNSENFSKFDNPLPNITNHNYEDPMSRPRLSIIGKLENIIVHNRKKGSYQDTQYQIYMQISQI